ncbi:uncharacterized protein IL334_006024 [Kwoniella shivajii]|uniref:Myb/SANT-like domain-containing protein n=1 Tax=Kwoniella shivajii TaxID=564305 RepID=A0ABZ1D4S1_9TREE|nr:hypothetical protein IL334_006024 [Kwoniella shivajii]
MAPKAGVSVRWTGLQTLKLLEFIASNDTYRRALFPSSTTQIKNKLMVAQEACEEFLRYDDWMRDAERRGLVTWNERMGKWDIKDWDSNVANPIYTKVNSLRKSFEEGRYKDEHGFKNHWNSFDDIRDISKKNKLQKAHPYFFLLRRLCTPQYRTSARPQPLVLPDFERSFPPSAKRKDRSPSILPESSSDSEESQTLPKLFDFDSPSSPVRAPLSKRVKWTVPSSPPTSEQEMDDSVTRTTTPLRALELDPVQEERVRAELEAVVEVSSQGPSREEEDMGAHIISDAESTTSSSSHISSVSSISSASDLASIQELTPSKLSSMPKSSKSRRSVINNTAPDQRLRIQAGPGLLLDDAIDLENTRSPLPFGKEITKGEGIDSDRLNYGPESPPRTRVVTSIGNTGTIPDARKAPTPGVRPSAGRCDEVQFTYMKDLPQIVKNAIKMASVLDSVTTASAPFRTLREGCVALARHQDLYKGTKQKELLRGSSKERRWIVRRGQIEMGVEAVCRLMEGLNADGPHLLMSNYRLLVEPADSGDSHLMLLQYLLQRTGATPYSTREAFEQAKSTNALYIAWLGRPRGRKVSSSGVRSIPAVDCIQTVLAKYVRYKRDLDLLSQLLSKSIEECQGSFVIASDKRFKKLVRQYDGQREGAFEGGILIELDADFIMMAVRHREEGRTIIATPQWFIRYIIEQRKNR